MRLHTRSKHKLQSGIVIILVLSILMGISLNYASMHIHIVDGRVVVHSHYTGSDKNSSHHAQHKHSNLQFLHHYLTSVFDKLIVTFYAIVFIAALFLIFIMISDVRLSRSSIYLNYLHRAPPASSVSHTH